MAEVILNLPLGRRGQRSKYRDLFAKVSDGQIWKIAREEFEGSQVENFRCRIQNWARKHGLQCSTRTDESGNMYVQMKKAEGFKED